MIKKKGLKLFMSGFAISFLGSMPPGTLNMTTLHLAAFNSISAALWFAFGAIIIEMFYAAFAVTLLHRINIPDKWKKGTLWIFAIGLILYGCFVLYTVLYYPENTGVDKVSFSGSAFLFGVSLSIVNPIQVPFWLFWGTVLKQRNLLANSKTSIILYTISAGAGALSLLTIYSFLAGENRFWINQHQYSFMIFYGAVFLMLGIIQVWRNLIGSKYSLNTE
jgi:threonine/homoserine/homoserine lactone efflux protein